MKKVFIAYADDKMTYSLKRIGKEAKRLDVFDEIKLWSPSMLSEDFKKIELMQHSYGGGYWAWKPYIIRETIREFGDDTIICYTDAGCTLRKHSDWTLWIELMKNNDTILFQYPDEMSIWEKFGTSSTKIKYWTKKQAILFYDKMTGSTNWRESNKIWGGALWMKGINNPVLNDWYNMVTNHPEIINDPTDKDDQFDFFVKHKHDQSMLVALSYKHKDNCCLLPATGELCGNLAAIEASRIRAKNSRDFMILKLKDFTRSLLGISLYNRIKNLVK